MRSGHPKRTLMHPKGVLVEHLNSQTPSQLDTLCGCEELGVFNSGVRGILAGKPYRKGRGYIERCDMCCRFESDEAACNEYARQRGGKCSRNRYGKVVWIEG